MRIAPPVLAAALLLAFAPAPAPAQQNYVPGHPYLVVETGQRYNRLQDAIFAIGAGKGTIRIDPGRWDDCGVQIAGDITFEAAIPGKTTFTGPRVCETKAPFVVRGRRATITGFVFDNIHTNEGNGAGIRVDGGDLVATNNLFENSDEGILTGPNPTGSVVVDRSTFRHLGRCGGYASCAHAIYVSFFNTVTVTNNRFESGNGGHYLKTRSAHVTVTNNVFDDTGGHASNYMIDLPAGATGRISGNVFTQGTHKENPSALIAIAAEGHEHSSAGLAIAGNTARMAPGAAPTAFVADWSHDALALGHNDLAPTITPLQPR